MRRPESPNGPVMVRDNRKRGKVDGGSPEVMTTARHIQLDQTAIKREDTTERVMETKGAEVENI